MDAATLVTGAALAHAGLPWALHQKLGLGVVERVRAGRGEVALTFDDGPDPKTTPKVLEILAREGTRATFFVLEPRAREHPELIQELKAAGHEVALHGRVHRHAWLKNPFSLYPELKAAKESLEDLLGEPVRFYRPPHGGWTWPLLWASLKLGLVPVGWEVEAGDWRKDATPKAVAERVLARTLPGSVVVMHDAGPGGRVTKEAISLLLPELKARDYRPRPLGEAEVVVGNLKEAGPKLIRPVEEAFSRLFDVRPVAKNSSSLLRYAKAPLPADLPGFAKGTPAIELHLDSERLRRALEISPFHAVRLGRRSLAELKELVATSEELQKYEVFFAVSHLDPVLKALGFRKSPLPPGYAKRVAVWIALLNLAYAGRLSLPGEVALYSLAKEDLLRLY